MSELFLEDSIKNLKEEVKIEYPINVNEASKETLLAVGFNDYQSNAIIGFREKIGPFETLEDLNKVYGMNDSTYQEVIDKVMILVDSSQIENKEEKKKKVRLFQFNPNKVSKKELKKLGFSKRQIRHIIKYRDKGGKFYKKSDLMKMYSIDEKDFDQWEKYIIIPELSEDKIEESKGEENKKEVEQITIDINKADALEFQKIRGIGEKLSERIIKYRDQLGGFVQINQLKEVYYLPPELIDEKKDQFFLGDEAIKTININEVDIKTFIKHPYVNYNMALRIVNFREVHGLFKSVDEIKTNDLVTDEDYSKLVNYLSVK